MLGAEGWENPAGAKFRLKGLASWLGGGQVSGEAGGCEESC